MKIEKEKVENLLKESNSYNDLSKRYFGYANAKSIKKMRDFIFNNNLDNSHFGFKNRKYDIIEKKCPVCKKKFRTRKGHIKEKVTCSCSCSNVYFSGISRNLNISNYRTICFKTHQKECIVCGENKIVEVHHYDENNKNNDPENLIPLCPTHHKYYHSRYKHIVEQQIEDFRDNFINSVCV